MTEVFTLGGRLFEPAASSTTFEQDAYLQGLVYEHRLHEVIQDGGDVAGAIFRSGQVTRFLAAILVEVDTEWTRESAEANARFLGQLRAPEEKQRLQDTLGGLLVGFSSVAPRSSAPSPTSSSETVTAPARRSRRSPRPPAIDLAHGPASSPDSPTTTASA